jgi:hypothetical protein
MSFGQGGGNMGRVGAGDFPPTCRKGRRTVNQNTMKISDQPVPLVLAISCGELTMTVLTLARARLAGVAIDPRSAIVGVLHPDGGIFTAIGFERLADLQDVIAQMQPRSITVEGTPQESVDVSLLRLVLRTDAAIVT